MDRWAMSRYLSRYRSEEPIMEQLASTLYDYREIESVPENIRFFNLPVGTFDPVTKQCRTRIDTAMMLANELPQPQVFLISGVRVVFIPDCRRHRGIKKHDEYDVRTVLLGGSLRLMIQNREYLYESPLARFPACFPKTWMAELAYLSEEDEEPHWRLLYDPALPRLGGMAYYKMTPLLIQTRQFFDVQIDHKAAPLNAPGKLGVILDGRLMREGWR